MNMPEDFSVPEAPGGDAPSGLSESEAGELAELRVEMSDTKGVNYDGNWSSQYWHNTAKQDRARDLMSREAGDPGEAPAGDGAEHSGELL